jgi:hypothetical protein
MGNSPLLYHSNWVIFVSKHRNIYKEHLENARVFAQKKQSLKEAFLSGTAKKILE